VVVQVAVAVVVVQQKIWLYLSVYSINLLVRQ
jgi:hypothetical protein